MNLAGENLCQKSNGTHHNKTLLGKESLVEHSNLTGIGKTEIKLNVSREYLGSKIYCKVESKALDKPLSAFVQLDINLRPNSTVITRDQGEIRAALPVSAGARPAAVINWFKDGQPIVDSDTQPVQHMSTLQTDSQPVR